MRSLDCEELGENATARFGFCSGFASCLSFVTQSIDFFPFFSPQNFRWIKPAGFVIKHVPINVTFTGIKVAISYTQFKLEKKKLEKKNKKHVCQEHKIAELFCIII